MKKAAVLALISALTLGGALAQAQDTPWTDRIKLSGDIRVRHDWRQAAGQDRHLDRFRLRLGLDAQINEQFVGIVRIASGDVGGITSTNETMDGAFGNKEAILDLASIRWTPLDVLKVNLGKMSNPFYAPNKYDLLFDGDITPEGYAVQYKQDMGGIDVFSNLGAFFFDERAADPEITLLGAQLGAGFDLGDKMELKAGVSRYHFTSIRNTTPVGAATGQTNSTTAGGGYATGFEVMEYFAEASSELAGAPVSLYGGYSQNMQATDNEVAYIAGAKVGELKGTGSWIVDYNYRNLDQDAFIGGLTDGDFAGGGTAAYGHKLSVGSMVAQKTALSLAYFNTDRLRNGAWQNYETYLVDFLVSF